MLEGVGARSISKRLTSMSQTNVCPKTSNCLPAGDDVRPRRQSGVSQYHFQCSICLFPKRPPGSEKGRDSG